MTKPRIPCIRIAPVAAVIAVTGLVLSWFEHASSKPKLDSFDPQRMGYQEAMMWRSYYEGKWRTLGWQTWVVARREYGFSWWDSLQLAIHAARAALYFRKNSDDPRCLPELEAYYRIIRRALRSDFDVSRAARFELKWWKQRRQNLSAQDYGRTIAELAALVYGVSEQAVLPASIVRAEAMAYRDARRNGRMTEADWEEIADRLGSAYASLKDGLSTAR